MSVDVCVCVGLCMSGTCEREVGKMTMWHLFHQIRVRWKGSSFSAPVLFKTSLIQLVFRRINLCNTSSITHNSAEGDKSWHWEMWSASVTGTVGALDASWIQEMKNWNVCFSARPGSDPWLHLKHLFYFTHSLYCNLFVIINGSMRDSKCSTNNLHF